MFSDGNSHGEGKVIYYGTMYKVPSVKSWLKICSFRVNRKTFFRISLSVESKRAIKFQSHQKVHLQHQWTPSCVFQNVDENFGAMSLVCSKSNRIRRKNKTTNTSTNTSSM